MPSISRYVSIFLSSGRRKIGDLQFQVVNTLNKTVPLTVDLDVTFSDVNGTILTNEDINAFNYRDNRMAVVPVPLTLPPTNNQSKFDWQVPAHSITVLQFDL